MKGLGVMGFYSFVVVAPDEIPLPEYLLYLDPGRNVFNARVNDLDFFKKRMDDAGVKILQINRLDVFEKVDPIEQDPFEDETPLLSK